MAQTVLNCRYPLPVEDLLKHPKRISFVHGYNSPLTKTISMKKILVILVLITGSIWARGQFVTDYLKAADTYYRKGDYYSAAQYYEKYLNSKTSKAKPEDYNPYNVKPAAGAKSAAPNAQLAVYSLAESYRQLTCPVKAVAYYEKALSYKN